MRRVGKTYFTDNADDLTPLLPFFILDEVYQLYLKHILPLECSHEARRWKVIWGKTYTDLNHKFFSAFDDDQRDAVIDRMDGFARFVEDSVKETYEASVAYLATQIPKDKCHVVSVCMICSVLAQNAAIIWQKVYRGQDNKGSQNAHIERLLHATSRFLNSWHKPDRHVTCNDDSEVDASVTRLQSRIVAWLAESRGWQTETDSETMT